MLRLALPVLFSVALLQGCGLMRLGDNLPYGVLNHDDIHTVAEGLPSYLLTLDGMIENWPESENLLRSGATLYSAYAGTFVEEQKRRERLADRALDYATRAACEARDTLCDARELSVMALEERVAATGRRDIEALYTLGTVWAGWVEIHSDDWNAVADLARVEPIITRVTELDPGYQQGQAWMYLGVLNSLLPASLGGQPEQSREYFEKAVEYSDGRNLMAKVLFAEHYARLAFESELHDELLEAVLEADPHEHGLTLQNRIAQRQARALLDESPDYF